MKTEWNLGLLYASPKDPQIEKDVEAYGKVCQDFEQKYKGKTEYFENDEALFAALTDYEKFIETLYAAKPAIYFELSQSIESDNTENQARLNVLKQQFDKEFNRIIFFELDLGKLPAEKKQEFLKSKKLEHFRYFLQTLFNWSEHFLTEAEEKIMNLKSLPSRVLWSDGVEKAVGKLQVPFGKKKISVSEAVNLIPNLPRAQRIKLHKDTTSALKSIGDFAESEMNAIITDKKINDELKKFEKPYSATFLNSQNTETEIITLMETLGKHTDIPARFFNLKKKLLKLPHLTWTDRSASIGKFKKKINFKEGYKLVRDIFAGLNPFYAETLDSFVKNGQIDVYPRQHKRGGAFCASFIKLPTYILLNWVPDANAGRVLAHEMGHAIHAEFTRGQSALYESHTLSVAEVASTLFEHFVFDATFEKLSDKEKIVVLHDRIVDSLGTTFQQLTAFRFELEMHNTIREKGFMSKEEIAKLFVKHTREMNGKAVKLDDEDGYLFVRWGHLRSFFYNYPYAYGYLVSRGLHKKYKEDKNYLTKIEQFMKAGTSKSPHDIFMDIGIDTSKAEFWEEGIRSIEEDIELLERLTTKSK